MQDSATEASFFVTMDYFRRDDTSFPQDSMERVAEESLTDVSGQPMNCAGLSKDYAGHSRDHSRRTCVGLGAFKSSCECSISPNLDLSSISAAWAPVMDSAGEAPLIFTPLKQLTRHNGGNIRLNCQLTEASVSAPSVCPPVCPSKSPTLKLGTPPMTFQRAQDAKNASGISIAKNNGKTSIITVGLSKLVGKVIADSRPISSTKLRSHHYQRRNLCSSSSTSSSSSSSSYFRFLASLFICYSLFSIWAADGVEACSRVSAPPPPPQPKTDDDQSRTVIHKEIPCQNQTLLKYYCLNGGSCVHMKSMFGHENFTKIGPYFCKCTSKWIGRRCEDRFIDLTLLGSLGIVVPVVVIGAVILYICWRRRRRRRRQQRDGGRPGGNSGPEMVDSAGIIIENGVRNEKPNNSYRDAHSFSNSPPVVLGPLAMLNSARTANLNSNNINGGSRNGNNLNSLNGSSGRNNVTSVATAIPARVPQRHPSIGAPLADTDEVDIETPFYSEEEKQNNNRF